jgi:type IV secretory pathway TrbD component
MTQDGMTRGGMTRRRVITGLVAALLVGVEAIWLVAIAAALVWLVAH